MVTVHGGGTDVLAVEVTVHGVGTDVLQLEVTVQDESQSKLIKCFDNMI